MALLLVGGGSSFCTNLSHPFWFPRIYCPGEPGSSKARHCRSACAHTGPADQAGPCATQNPLLSKTFPGSSQQWERLFLPGATGPLVWHCLQEGGDQGATSSALSTTCTVSAKANLLFSAKFAEKYGHCLFSKEPPAGGIPPFGLHPAIPNSALRRFQTLSHTSLAFSASKPEGRYSEARTFLFLLFFFSCKGQARALPQAAAGRGLLPTLGALCSAGPGLLEQANGDPQECQ